MKNVQLRLRSPFEVDDMGLYLIGKPKAKDVAEIKPSRPFSVDTNEFCAPLKPINLVSNDANLVKTQILNDSK